MITLRYNEEQRPTCQNNICINYMRNKNIHFKIQTSQTVLYLQENCGWSILLHFLYIKKNHFCHYFS